MPKLDLDSPAMLTRSGSRYPPPYDAPNRERHWLRLGATAGLTDFGVNLVIVPPGIWSSQRHWHEADDEFLWMVEGELVLIENAGRTVLRAGNCAAFPKNSGDGHHLVNETAAPARFLVIGSNKGGTSYPDIDLHSIAGEGFYRHKDGTPY